MAIKKLQTSSETSETKPTSRTYTAKSIAQEFGFDASGIEKYYYPEACTLYQTCPEVLKENHLFTQTFYDLVFLFRQHRMRERCVLNESGLIVRHAPISGDIGKPLLRKNEARLSAEAFRAWFWEMNPELQPLIAGDAPETVELVEVQKAELVLYESDAYNEESSTSIDGTLVEVEQFGLSFQSFEESLVQQFRNEGRATGARAINAFKEELEETTRDFFQATAKAVKRTK